MKTPNISVQQAIALTKTHIDNRGYGHLIDLSSPPTFYSNENGDYWLVHTFLEYQDYGAIRDGYISPGVQKEYRTYKVDVNTLEVT